MTHKKRSSVTPVQLIALGFLIMMLLGTGLLLLPISQRHPGSLSIVDAAFTAVSAVSTTGLTVVDTASTFSTFGYVALYFNSDWRLGDYIHRCRTDCVYRQKATDARSSLGTGSLELSNDERCTNTDSVGFDYNDYRRIFRSICGMVFISPTV